MVDDVLEAVAQRVAGRRAKAALDGRFAPSTATVQATVVGAQVALVEGVPVPTVGVSSDLMGKTLPMRNIRRPAAALYAPTYGGGVVSTASGVVAAPAPVVETEVPKPYATVVVAASDSKHPYAKNADFVCDGVSDQVQIMAALLQANALGYTQGGLVLLLDGLFSLDAPIAWPENASGVTLQGLGVWATCIWWIEESLPGGDMISLSDANVCCRIYDIWFSHSRASTAGCNIASRSNAVSDVRIERCVFEMAAEDAIHFEQADYLQVTDCDFESALGAAVYVGNVGSRLVVMRNLATVGGAAAVYVGGRYFQILDYEGGMVEGWITDNYLSSRTYAVDIGQQWASGEWNITGNMGGALRLRKVTNGRLAHNEVEEGGDYGIVLDACSRVLVANNYVEKTYYDALTLTDSVDCLVNGNLLHVAGYSADAGPFAAVRLNGSTGSTRNLLAGNMVRGADQDYAVIVEVGSNDNAFLNNDWRGAWSVAATSDAGTGTVWQGNLS